MIARWRRWMRTAISPPMPKAAAMTKLGEDEATLTEVLNAAVREMDARLKRMELRRRRSERLRAETRAALDRLARY